MDIATYLDGCTPEGRAELEQILEVDAEMKAAIENGTEYAWEAQSDEYGNAFASACGESDCATGYHRVSYVMEYATQLQTDGSLIIEQVVKECDSDGNWEAVHSVEFNSPRYAAELEEYQYPAAAESWKRYAAHVIETGEDPIGEYGIVSVEVNDLELDILFFETATGLEIVGGGYVEGHTSFSVATAPRVVFDYFNCTREHPIVGTENLRNPAEPLEVAEDENLRTIRTIQGYDPDKWRATWGPWLVYRGEFKVETPRTDEERRAILRERASRI